MTSESRSASTSSKIAAFALSSSLFLLSLSGLASLNGIVVVRPAASSGSLRQTHAETTEAARPIEVSFAAAGDVSFSVSVSVGPGATSDGVKPYYIFLQKFPLEYTFKSIFHTEVVLCPKETLDRDFSDSLDGLLASLEPSRFSQTNAEESSPGKSPFVQVPEDKWSTQASPGCVQLGYGGSSCNTPCCSVPHTSKNVAYALNSRQAVIANAMGDYKQLFLYGATQLKDGVDAAFKAVCHGHYGAVEEGTLPACVSNWAGTDYNPITNNCNTFTSTLLKCVFGLTDAKPSLWVSDLINVHCPTEMGGQGQSHVQRCMVPTGVVETYEAGDVLTESQ